MTRHPITDRQVADLPVHGGRAELLEEIMHTPVDHVDSSERASARRGEHPPRRTRALASLAAAAAVLATVAGLAAWQIPHNNGSGLPEPSRYADGTAVAPANGSSSGQVSRPAPSVPGGAYVALNQAGWAVTSVFEGPQGSDLFYERDGAVLDLTTYPAADYASYVADRDGDAGSSQPLTLLGRSARMWAYASDDHTAIRAAEGDRFLEVRGTGLSEDAFRAALADLVQTDAAGFAQALPGDVVTPYNRDRAIRHLLRGVDTPPGFTIADVRMQGFNDGYQAAAHVSGSVGCAWLDVWQGGSAADRQATIAAFESSRSWPLLVGIRDQGGWAQGFWSVARQLKAGHGDKGGPLDIEGFKASFC